MKLIHRGIEKDFIRKIKPGKVLILLGARRVGKTFFLNTINDKIKGKKLYINGEDIFMHEIFSNRTKKQYSELVEDNEILIIDEAQKIPNIGLSLKFLVDEFPKLKVIATGSSVFDLKNQLGEPLTGRKNTIMLFPIAQIELKNIYSTLELKQQLPERLVFGSYPEIFQLKTKREKIEYLKELTNDYLLKDVLSIDGIRHSTQMFHLLKLLAYQVGQEVSYQELGTQLNMSKNTVEKYMDILSKVFIIHKLPGFSKNLRKEITKNSKWYFYDNGILNAFLNNFNNIANRTDIGTLWENFIISERLKYQHIKKITANNYFWRTYTQQEIDWIEERNGKLYAYEFKWNPNKPIKAPPLWQKQYPSPFQLIHQNNFLEFVT